MSIKDYNYYFMHFTLNKIEKKLQKDILLYYVVVFTDAP